MAKKPVRKRLDKKSMKRTKGGLIGLLMPSAGIKITGIKMGSPIAPAPLNQIPPVPCN